MDRERFFPPKFWAKPGLSNIAQKFEDIVIVNRPIKILLMYKIDAGEHFSSLQWSIFIVWSVICLLIKSLEPERKISRSLKDFMIVLKT
ncbi:hypothetical protein EUGRSUZ_C03775 [Eucalyptus grandis]|uniref:Uncharacterized protein n=2 Tax=Eucalyptus grandis TaxID=71139 RepID=A0ACC3LLC9_EUCGR|nr:hypothetical protein EUGRSUZ_C03775 [Eucalyptus grandis]